MRRTAALLTTVMAAMLTVVLVGCSAGAVRSAGATSSGADQPAASTEVQAEVQRAVDSFNAGAGGPVAGQQIALAALLDVGQQPVQRGCAAATTTLKFEPVYGRLAPTPGWKPAQGTLSGEVYALPTLIRIYTGDRITGTDLTDLHIAVQNGRARLPALCLS